MRYELMRPHGIRAAIAANWPLILPLAQDLFRSLLRIGFRNIHFFIYHQSENFAAGMPTDLAFKLAARQVTFEFLEGSGGREGWWGDNSMDTCDAC